MRFGGVPPEGVLGGEGGQMLGGLKKNQSVFFVGYSEKLKGFSFPGAGIFQNRRGFLFCTITLPLAGQP